MATDASSPSASALPEQRFEALFNWVLDAILIADDTGRYIDANPAACTLLEMTREQLLGRSILELVGVAPELTCALWSQFLAQGEQKGEFELRTGKGRRIWVEYSARAHFLPGQHLSLLREVTRRKRAESLLALLTEASEVLVGSLEQQQVLHAVPGLAVKQLGDGCLVGLLERGELRYVAAAHRDPARPPLPEEPQLYQPLLSLLAPSWQALSAGQVVQGQTTPEQVAALVQDEHVARCIRALEPYAYLVVPLVTRQRMLGLLVLISSQPGWRFEAEEQVAALELARVAALALENAWLYQQSREELRRHQETMAMVAHDLRNPLNALSLRARGLEQRVRQGQCTLRLTDAQALQHIVRQMERLLVELVDLASLEAGGLLLTQRPQQVGELLTEAMELLEPLGQQRGVKVELRPLEEPLTVYCDGCRIIQVLSNLMGNALKFTPEGGRVTLAVTESAGMAVFSVSDTGVGLKPEELSHVFERYWRAPGAKKTSGQGLGLAIVKGIVEAHGGTVWAQSQPEHGSTFCFTVPLAPGEQAPVSEADPL